MDTRINSAHVHTLTNSQTDERVYTLAKTNNKYKETISTYTLLKIVTLSYHSWIKNEIAQVSHSVQGGGGGGRGEVSSKKHS